MTALVEVVELSKVYEPTPAWMRALVRSSIAEPVHALDGVSLRIGAGEICAVIGPNGAGKSTLFRILTGLTTPTAGSVRVLGMDPETEAHRIRRYVGFMPAEDRTLFLRHTGRENLRFHGRLQGLSENEMPERIDAVLDLVGLHDARDRTGFALSSGMRARLMLARAILHEPRVLILDEPTGAVDPLSAHEFLDLIVKLTVERGLATLISSHRLEEIDVLRDNVLLLDQGRAVFWGNLDHVKHVADRRTYEISCVDEMAASSVVDRLRSSGHGNLSKRGATVIFPVEPGRGQDLGWLNGMNEQVESVAVRKRSLRETIGALLDEGDPT